MHNYKGEVLLRGIAERASSRRCAWAKAPGIGQDGVSELEKRADLMISTLRKTVEALGGSLSLVADMRNPINKVS